MNDSLPQILLYISLGSLIVTLILAFIRLLKGPTAHDRIVAMDFISSVVMGFILVYSVQIHKDFYIDIVILISLISFVGTVAISTYLKQNQK